jgi:hypothetical protein
VCVCECVPLKFVFPPPLSHRENEFSGKVFCYIREREQVARTIRSSNKTHTHKRQMKSYFSLSLLSLYHLKQAQNVVQFSAPQQQHQQQPPPQQQPFMGNALRKEAPITQKSAPVYQSQPVATSFQGEGLYPNEKWHRF